MHLPATVYDTWIANVPDTNQPAIGVQLATDDALDSFWVHPDSPVQRNDVVTHVGPHHYRIADGPMLPKIGWMFRRDGALG